MRIIQGKYKGRKLEGFNLEGTRPTMERVKESLFAMLQPYIEESFCLDLFAGSGNLGLEALSMGAKKVVFVDQNPKAVQVIKKNLAQLQEEQEVILGDYLKALKELEKEKRQFDILFLDPPYQTNYIEKALSVISQFELIKEEGIIVCESDTRSKIVFHEKDYQVWKEKKYGDKYIVILKRVVE